jgi:hypothetical protein
MEALKRMEEELKRSQAQLAQVESLCEELGKMLTTERRLHAHQSLLLESPLRALESTSARTSEGSVARTSEALESLGSLLKHGYGIFACYLSACYLFSFLNTLQDGVSLVCRCVRCGQRVLQPRAPCLLIAWH